MILDIYKPYKCLDKAKNPDYVLQDGEIFNWSESNCCYESAWWLTATGEPINDSEHVQNLLNDRPFNKSWLFK